MADIFVEPCHVKLLLSLGFSKTLLSFSLVFYFTLLSGGSRFTCSDILEHCKTQLF